LIDLQDGRTIDGTVFTPGRGNLYHSDIAKRKQQREEDVVYYEANEGGARRSRRYYRPMV
jgi:hypothetical protein